MADVHLAVQLGDEGFAKLVVEKRGRGAVCRRPDLARGFLGEARLLARLSHPNVVQVLDLGADDGGPFVVVEYLSGETLSTILRLVAAAGERMPWPLVVRMVAGVAAGLAAAHGALDVDGRTAPILHRDLTPSNVIVCYTGATKIIDFGIARLVAEGGDTRVGMVKGKLSYLAPELLAGRRADPRCDLFQLGILLHESLTGQRLFDAASDTARVEAVLERPIGRPGQSVEGLPAEVDRVALALLERDPARRTASAESVRADLEEVLRRSGATASEHDLGAWLRRALATPLAERRQRELECLRLVESSATPPATAPRRPRWRRRLIGVSALALSGLIGVGAGAGLGQRWPARAPAGKPIESSEPVRPPSPEQAPAPRVTPLDATAPRPSTPADPAPPHRAFPPGRARRDRPARHRTPDARDRPIDRVHELEASPRESAPPPATDNIDPWAL